MPTPAIAPPPPAVPPTWQPEWSVWLLALPGGRYAQAAHDAGEIQDAEAA